MASSRRTLSSSAPSAARSAIHVGTREPRFAPSPPPRLPAPARSWERIVIATRQPSPTSPTRHASGTTAPSTNTSLKWASLFIWRNGRTSTPGASIAITNIVRPLCLGWSGSVRARQMAHFDHIARLVQVFWPPSRHTSPSSAALRATLARSEPASGSENIWHQISAPDAIGHSQRSCCSAVPCASRAGPTMPRPIANG